MKRDLRHSVRFGARGHAIEVEIFSSFMACVSYACVLLRMLLQVRSAGVGETGVMENRLKSESGLRRSALIIQVLLRIINSFH